MTPLFSQTMDIGLLLVGVVLAALALTMIALGVRSRRRRGREPLGVASLPREPEPVAAPKLTALDGAALMAAVKEAEADGQSKRLPGLYLSLARWRLDSGESVGGGGASAQEHPRRHHSGPAGDACQCTRCAGGSRADQRRSRHRLRALADRAFAVPRAATGARARRCRRAHAAQRLSDRLGADRFLAPATALTASGLRPEPLRRWPA